MQPCKRRVRPPPGSPPAQGRSPPEQAQSEKSQGVRGTESPDSSVNTKETENYVSVFSGELPLLLSILWQSRQALYGAPDRLQFMMCVERVHCFAGVSGKLLAQFPGSLR